MAGVGLLTARQYYYKGIYFINPNYCLYIYICIYEVHITHIWTYGDLPNCVNVTKYGSM